MKPHVYAIAAMAQNRVIGKDGSIPWRISDELRWFKKVTLGHTVVMGRKTWESLGRPLPGRRNVVVSSRMEPLEGVEVISSLEAFDPAQWVEPGGALFVIGGGEIYRRLLPMCEAVYLSVVPLEVEGDTFFPLFEEAFSEMEVALQHPEFEARIYRRNQ